MLLIVLLAALRISVGIHGSEQIWTDLSRSVLLLEDKHISSERGSGGSLLSAQEDLFWKECPADEPQRIVSLRRGEIFSREYFSGPYSDGSNNGMLISIPGEILMLDLEGTVHRSFPTGEYPGSLCSDGETIWFVSSRDALLKTMVMATGTTDAVELCFSPTTVEYSNGLLLIGRSDGGYSVTEDNGTLLLSIPNGFFGHFSGDENVSFTRCTSSYGCETLAWETVTINIRTGAETVVPVQTENITLYDTPGDDPAVHFDVPYMHQRWDTPDWFDGSWSCGPASCMMASQYYNRLTPDSIWCSYPDGHWSEWGNYIPTEYAFLGYTYDILGKSPGGVWVPGAHGFICRNLGGAIWAMMTLWLNQHGLDSSQLGTTWNSCILELDNFWPVVASTTSPYTSGHILLFNGYYDNHSVICNDAYGNQNLPGWGTLPNGKDVVYDWPGYNNGNTQLGISQLHSARSEVLSPANELIDDRSLGYRKLGPCQHWHEQETGYNGYSWWTYSTGALPDTCIVEWVPLLSLETWYLIETFIPAAHATATGIYSINTASGWETASVNQGAYSDQWASLGSFALSPSSAMVRMGDYTGTQGQYISFDAVRFTLQTSIGDQNYFTGSGEFGISHNPVQTGSPLVFNLPDDFSGTVQIYDLAGRLAAETETSVVPGILPAGIYHALLREENNHNSIRFTVIE